MIVDKYLDVIKSVNFIGGVVVDFRICDPKHEPSNRKQITSAILAETLLTELWSI